MMRNTSILYMYKHALHDYNSYNVKATPNHTHHLTWSHPLPGLTISELPEPPLIWTGTTSLLLKTSPSHYVQKSDIALSNTSISLQHTSYLVIPAILHGGLSSLSAIAENCTEFNFFDIGDHKCSIGLQAEYRAAYEQTQRISRLHCFHSLMKKKAFRRGVVF